MRKEAQSKCVCKGVTLKSRNAAAKQVNVLVSVVNL